ncbi:oxidoreductase NAD-binding domain-containing protein [Phlyctema vagabunda]|uniref:Oxidoreductase NAD-binding domain-containing protein n=1 Tax=Phlyctema vagabunda TaxID=108571 RepID=A0ABR4PP15_9HELO
MAELKEISMSEIAKHNTKNDLWLTIHGKVYDVSDYLEDHPGGIEALVEVAGQDSTVAFEDIGHSEDAREQLAEFIIGRLDGHEDDEHKQPSTQKLPKPTPQVPNFHANQSGGDKKSVALRASILTGKLSITALVAFAGYQVCSRGSQNFIPTGKALQRLQLGNISSWLNVQNGGFAKGVVVSSVGSLSVLGYLVNWIQKQMPTNKHPYAFPPHFKPKVNPIKPVTRQVGFLKPQQYQKLPLIEKKQLSSNSTLLVFKLPSESMVLGLPIGQHVSIRAEINGKTVSRSYTPVSNNSDPGVLRLVIKMYPGGALTGGYLQDLKVGDEVEFRGPKGAMRYRRGIAKQICMVAGGTGITPMYQLIRAICEDPRDNTEIKLLYGNNDESDILLREELDGFAQKYPHNFQYQSVLASPSSSWNGLKGFISKDLCQSTFPQPSADVKVLLCGPPGLINAMKTSLPQLGFEKPSAVSKLTDQVFSF